MSANLSRYHALTCPPKPHPPLPSLGSELLSVLAASQRHPSTGTVTSLQLVGETFALGLKRLQFSSRIQGACFLLDPVCLGGVRLCLLQHMSSKMTKTRGLDETVRLVPISQMVCKLQAAEQALA